MNDDERFMNKKSVKQVLSDIGKQMHMSAEMILAHARGILSPDGSNKVASHIKTCQECSEIFTLAQKTLDEEKNAGHDTAEPRQSIPMNAKLASKLKLAARLNSKKDELSKNISRLFIAKESWPSIDSALIILKNWHKYSTEQQELENSKEPLPIAAFSSGAGPETKQNLETIIKVIDFVDSVHDTLLERCDNLEQVEKELPKCIDEAATILDGLELDETTKHEILKYALESFSCDSN